METAKARIAAKKSVRALDAGGRDATMVTAINLDHLQVCRKWEISVHLG